MKTYNPEIAKAYENAKKNSGKPFKYKIKGAIQNILSDKDMRAANAAVGGFIIMILVGSYALPHLHDTPLDKGLREKIEREKQIEKSNEDLELNNISKVNYQVPINEPPVFEDIDYIKGKVK